MTSQSPWSIKGIEPEAREAAKMAARKAGMTLGGWLTRTILSVAAHELKRNTAGKPPPEWEEGAGPDLSPPSPPALTEEAILKSIQQLIQRVEHIEQVTQETIAPISEKVEQLAERVKEVNEKTGISAGPLERALQRLTERMDTMEVGDAAPEQEREKRPRPQRSRFARMFNLP
ncbi:MAG: hypothetical protein J4G10_02165 [Alphaproteobacteria bacterium]|nr:hypothetical protein [Alphaproteobacteria bacterium]